MGFHYSDDYVDQLCDQIEELVETFGFESAGVEGKSLADDAVHAVAESISEDCREGKAPDGSEWAPNKEPYRSWKAKKYGVHDPGYLTGQTLSIESLVGEVEVTNDRVTMTHGVGAVDEDGVTDREKGIWLTEGDEKQGREPRPFYALNDDRSKAVVDVLSEGLGRHLRGES
jgi:hypothetical protein